jgi:hypothetical protein
LLIAGRSEGWFSGFTFGIRREELWFSAFISLVVVVVCYTLLCLRLFQAVIVVLLQLQNVGGCWLWLAELKFNRFLEGKRFLG